MEYEKLEREWNDYERIMQREKAKYLEDLIDRQVKRKRDISIDDDDDKANRRKIRSRDNRRKRLREKEEDERERIHELTIEEAKRTEIRRKLEEEEQRRKEEERLRLKQEQEARWERSPHNRNNNNSKSPLLSPNEHSNHTYSRLKQEPSSTFVTITLDPNESMRSPNSMSSKGFSVALKSNKRTVDASKQLGFSDEPEEDTVVPKKRALSSLDDEIARRAKEEDARAQARSVIEQIPVERDEVFNFTIDWKLVDEKHIIEQKLRPWIVKKKLWNY